MGVMNFDPALPPGSARNLYVLMIIRVWPFVNKFVKWQNSGRPSGVRAVNGTTSEFQRQTAHDGKIGKIQ